MVARRTGRRSRGRGRSWRASDEIRERVDFGGAKVIDNPVFGECASPQRRYRGGRPELRCDDVLLGDQPGVGRDELMQKVAAKQPVICVVFPRG
jgi:hypothetical protein